MNWLNIFFGIIGIVSFGFSIYVYYKTESKKVVEAAKIALQKERTKNIKISLIGVLHSIDAVVQIPKKGKATVEQLQDLARIARAQTYIVLKQLENEQNRLKDWRFGELIESNVESSDIKIPEVNDKKS